MEKEKNLQIHQPVVNVPKKMNKKLNIKMQKMAQQCGSCTANFEIWVDNSRLNQDREEKIRRQFLSYCPVCAKVSEK